jgi:lipoprotein-releasing system ATP-binding protein
MLNVVNLTKTFDDHIIFEKLNLSFEKTGMYFILGKSGTGKSTLLSILSGLAKPTSGKIIFENHIIDFDDSSQLNEYRRNNISFVFQDFNIIDEMTVKENLLLLGNENDVFDIIGRVGMSAQINQKCISLSGGEKQRVAIARSLLKKSKILFFDEPTGNLDKKNGEIVFNIFKELAEVYHQSLLIVTHDQEFAHKTHRIIEMEDGRIISL